MHPLVPLHLVWLLSQRPDHAALRLGLVTTEDRLGGDGVSLWYGAAVVALGGVVGNLVWAVPAVAVPPVAPVAVQHHRGVVQCAVDTAAGVATKQQHAAPVLAGVDHIPEVVRIAWVGGKCPPPSLFALVIASPPGFSRASADALDLSRVGHRQHRVIHKRQPGEGVIGTGTVCNGLG